MMDLDNSKKVNTSHIYDQKIAQNCVGNKYCSINVSTHENNFPFTPLFNKVAVVLQKQQLLFWDFWVTGQVATKKQEHLSFGNHNTCDFT